MFHRENIKKHNAAKIMAETFGRYNIFATLSLSLSQALTASHTLLEIAGTRANIRLSLLTGKGGRSVFYPHRNIF